MCRTTSEGGRRCKHEYSKALNTINQRILRTKKKLEATEDEAEFDRLAERLEKDEELKKSLRTKVLPLPADQKRVTVYRSGIPQPPTERGVEADSFAKADALRPEGRVGRGQALFAAPTLYGAGRWVRGNSRIRGTDITVHQFEVDPDEAWVYRVEAWEQASWGYSRTEEEAENKYRSYWDSGMTLRQWYERGINDGDKWELLLDAKQIENVQPVHPQRVINAGGNNSNELRYIYRSAGWGRNR